MLLRTCLGFLFLFGLTKGDIDNRLSVIKDRQADPIREHKHVRLAFSTATGRLRCAEWTGGTAYEELWSSWVDLVSPTPPVSNPVTVHDKANQTRVFFMGNDGQVYTIIQRRGKSGCASFTPQPSRKVSGNSLPFDAEAAKTVTGKDSLTAIRTRRDSDIYVFARTRSKPSQLFYTVFDGNAFTSWASMGGDLVSDVSVIDNDFTFYLEAYGIFADGSVYRIWQWKDKSWSSWTSLSYGQPSFVTTSRPVVHSMGPSTYNGRTEVLALGTDGMIHHCYQTTCDMVNNAWGLCTWSWWFKIKAKVFPVLSKINAISTAGNIHGGNEVFTIGRDLRVRHLWQEERGSTWNDWETIGRPVTNVGSLPLVAEDLWWGVHFEDDKKSKIIAVRQNRSMIVYPQHVAYGGVMAFAWDVPKDESSEKDWIGIFPAGASNNKYLDYRYVNGKLNPGATPTPKGKTGMKLFLPKGRYEMRYLVNGKVGVSVFKQDIESNSSSTRSKWAQIFRGLNRGLGQESLVEPDCVQDEEMLVKNFESAFAAFVKREFRHGTHLLGKAIHLMYQSLITCGEAKIAFKVIQFAADLMECTIDLCVTLVIDVAEEVYILYKERYEIYWNIRAATNAFKIGAYEQGAMSIGRLIRDSLGLPEPIMVKEDVIAALLEMGMEQLG